MSNIPNAGMNAANVSRMMGDLPARPGLPRPGPNDNSETRNKHVNLGMPKNPPGQDGDPEERKNPDPKENWSDPNYKCC